MARSAADAAGARLMAPSDAPQPQAYARQPSRARQHPAPVCPTHQQDAQEELAVGVPLIFPQTKQEVVARLCVGRTGGARLEYGRQLASCNELLCPCSRRLCEPVNREPAGAPPPPP